MQALQVWTTTQLCFDFSDSSQGRISAKIERNQLST
jgi:hypothetical protein